MDVTNEILDILPATARPKLERLSDAHEAAFAIVRAASDNLDEVRNYQWDQEKKLRGVLAEQRGTISNDVRESLQQPMERAKRETERAQARYDTASEGLGRWTAIQYAVDWLNQARRDRIRLRTPKLPTVKASDDHRAAVERIRAQLADLEEVWADTEVAPVPVANARENLFREIDAIAARGAPNVDIRRRAGSPISIEKALQVTKLGDGVVGDYGASFLVWFFREELKAKLGAMLDGRDQVGALTDEDRERTFGEIAAKRLELERLEEAHIVAAEAAGLMIPRRPEADPRAILEVDA